MHIPAIKPSLLSSSSVTASLISGFLKNAVINLPEPSGSSPPENPPGINIICDIFTLSAKSSTERITCSALRFLIIKISGSAPAASNAFAVSYSQFVPGNTGIRTLGFAIPIFL